MQEVSIRQQESIFPYKTPKLPGLIMNKASLILIEKIALKNVQILNIFLKIIFMKMTEWKKIWKAK